MAVTDLKIAQVRRMINEPDDADYTGEYDNVTISGYLTDYNEDVNAVASVILLEKASALQMTMYDYSTEGERFMLSQVIKNIENLAAKYASKRTGTTSLWIKAPDETSDDDTLQVG